MSKGLSRRTRMHLLFGSALVLLLLSAIAAYEAVESFRAAQEWVSHTRDVQSALAELNSACTRAGRARTRYVDSADDASLQDYLSAVDDIPTQLKQIKQATADNPEQQDTWAHLEALTNRRLNLLETSMQLKRSGAVNPQEQRQLRQQILDVSAESDSLFQTMQGAEQQLLDERRLHSQRLFRVTGYILAAAFLLALALFFFHYRLLNAELVAREQAESSLRSLSVRLLELQDQERRKFSRELHDSLGQYLVGVKMNLSMLDSSIPSNPLVAESMTLLDEAMTETRTISHLLHPPLLDETGFASAARWYVEGFSKRSGIPTSLDIPDDLGRMAEALELALFRVLQEGLTNVHRHSKSPRADVSLRVSRSEVVLRIRDYGKGISRDVLERFRQNRAHGGVGLAGMRERIHELGGHLDMDSDSDGTQILVRMPRSEHKNVLQASAD